MLEGGPRSGLSPERQAWTCLAANALVLPGLGSFFLGHRVAGLLQAAIALAGFVTSTSWATAFLARLPAEGLAAFEDPGPALGYMVAGLLVFGLAWLWSVATGLLAIRAVRARRAPGRANAG